MDNLERDVREQLSRHNSVFKTCNKLGITNVAYVADIQAKMEKETAPDLGGCEYDGYGRPELRDRLVARSLATEVWDNTRPEVADAREKYEAGTHDMATGRDGPYLLLYLTPRAVVQPRPGYFNLTTEG